MGGSSSRRHSNPPQPPKPVEKKSTGVSSFVAIPDKYRSLEEVQDALRKAGLESSNLIVGIDYTKSNTWNGSKTFGGNCLHAFGNFINPYQEVITIVGRTLEAFDDVKKLQLKILWNNSFF